MTRQEELNEAWCNYRGKCSTEIMHALAFALRWCDQHPRWISVEDELPPLEIVSESWKTSDDVLVYTLSGDMLVSRYEFSKLTKEHYWIFSDHDYIVTHWMPLPQPPMEIRGNQRKISPNQQQIIGTTDHIKIAMDVIDKKGGEQ